MKYSIGVSRQIVMIIGLFLFSSLLHAHDGEGSNMRGLRYCEIILSKYGFNVSVYNTAMLNDCPKNLWDKLTVDNIKKETGSYFIYLNGPRYWVFDGFKHAQLVDKKIRILGGIAMREAGVLHLSLMDMIKGAEPYRLHNVDRKTTWIYNAGKPIYELISPDHQVYVMQSYSTQQIPQTEADLSDLASKLKLPAGWRFRAGILQQDTFLTAINNKAVVIQDNLLNTYQLATHDFLEQDKQKIN